MIPQTSRAPTGCPTLAGYVAKLRTGLRSKPRASRGGLHSPAIFLHSTPRCDCSSRRRKLPIQQPPGLVACLHAWSAGTVDGSVVRVARDTGAGNELGVSRTNESARKATASFIFLALLPLDAAGRFPGWWFLTTSVPAMQAPRGANGPGVLRWARFPQKFCHRSTEGKHMESPANTQHAPCEAAPLGCRDGSLAEGNRGFGYGHAGCAPHVLGLDFPILFGENSRRKLPQCW